MTLIKKINSRISSIIIIFAILILLTNILLISFNSSKASEFTGLAYYKDTVNQMNDYSNILKDITNQVSRDEKIISILENTLPPDDIDILTLQKQLEMFEGILQTISFIRTINVVSLQGDYVFSGGKLYNNFYLEDRSWFKSQYLTPHLEPIITEVHKDFTTGKYSISIVKFIYSDGKLLGATILDIFIDDLLNFISNNFYLGSVNNYVPLNTDLYISSTGIYNGSFIPNKNSLVFSDNIFDNKINIIFEFDKDSFLYTKQLRKVNIITSCILIIVCFLLILFLSRLIELAFNPVVSSLNKLKILLANLEKNNFSVGPIDEFQQLELISESLGKSFDNKIQSLIYYDDLTKLPNRKLFMKITTSLIQNSKSFALIFIDLNKFKSINDNFGHSAGDELLINFGKFLEDAFKDKGIVVRYSGDEFVVIYENYTTTSELLNFYNSNISNRLLTPFSFSNNKVLIEISAGVSIYPKDGSTVDELITKSDFMMYESKHNSIDNSLMFFNIEKYLNVKNSDDIKFELKNAINNKEFILYYQPIIDSTKSIKKLEALLRWNNDKLGFMSPITFIKFAEDTRDIIPIGYWLIEKVCIDFKTLSLYHSNLQISINISPIQLLDINFVDNVTEILTTYNIDPRVLCFEITESVVLDDNIIVYDNIHSLHQLGISLALDDFGTGYSSFSYLKKYNLDILKIDKSFITNTKDKNFNIIKNIKNIAHLLNMTVVIEGVETEEQFNKLKEFDCNYFQGYFFSKPLPIDELKKIL